jgi:cyclophilin family peptidyl-prolyl cis-trans isomerase
MDFNMRNYLLPLAAVFFLAACSASRPVSTAVTPNDHKKDVRMVTDLGEIIIRLSDSTPLHRDNFLLLVKKGFYDSLLFHRVIEHFMIQGGDPNSRNAPAGIALGNGDVGYKVPAEFRTTLFHKKGVLAAAHDGNPEKASSGCQFYLVQGKVFTDVGLDSIETFRLNGRKIPADQRAVYKTLGGAPHLDQGYTVFGEVVSGLEVIDKIAGVTTTKIPKSRPEVDVYIKRVTLIKRKRSY